MEAACGARGRPSSRPTSCLPSRHRLTATPIISPRRSAPVRSGGGLREDKIAPLKAKLKMGPLAGLESSSARAEQLARQILIHGRPLSTQELMEKVEKVEAEDLQALVERMLASPASLA